jgi:hypothetical protein
MVPKPGLEPGRVVPTTPSRWRVYQFHHFGIKKLYLFTGAAGGITGSFAAFGPGAGSFAASGFVMGSACPVMGRLDRSINEELLWLAVYVSARDVSIKSIATPAVIFPKKVPAPEEPKTVWLEPPKAAPMSAPLPAWRSTMRIKTRQIKICKIIKNAYIKFFSS